jgi:hypothetical protein
MANLLRTPAVADPRTVRRLATQARTAQRLFDDAHSLAMDVESKVLVAESRVAEMELLLNVAETRSRDAAAELEVERSKSIEAAAIFTRIVLSKEAELESLRRSTLAAQAEIVSVRAELAAANAKLELTAAAHSADLRAASDAKHMQLSSMRSRMLDAISHIFEGTFSDECSSTCNARSSPAPGREAAASAFFAPLPSAKMGGSRTLVRVSPALSPASSSEIVAPRATFPLVDGSSCASPLFHRRHLPPAAAQSTALSLMRSYEVAVYVLSDTDKARDSQRTAISIIYYDGCESLLEAFVRNARGAPPLVLRMYQPCVRRTSVSHLRACRPLVGQEGTGPHPRREGRQRAVVL